jgi:hypothetical protein
MIPQAAVIDSTLSGSPNLKGYATVWMVQPKCD